MCFTGEMSAGFAVLGLYMTHWVWTRTKNGKLAAGIFFFFTMEALQAVQYMFLASGMDSPVCATLTNKVLTVLGFVHICAQPYFSQLINEALLPAPTAAMPAAKQAKLLKYSHYSTVIKRFCVLGGVLIFLRWPLSYVTAQTQETRAGHSEEWLKGEHLCTFKTPSMVHLGWAVPMSDSTYTMMGCGLHSFLMFAPFFAYDERRKTVLRGLVLMATGPGLAAAITGNMNEQASIWCFFSMCQLGMMLFLAKARLAREAKEAMALAGGAKKAVKA
jgi:hypothetical protein